MMNNIKHETVLELFDYNKESGVFIWKISPNGRVRKGSIAGRTDSKGHIQITYKRKVIAAHRLAWFYVYGVWPSGEIDHINHKSSDNRIDNLRVVSHAENMRNAKRNVNNKSGWTGVWWSERRKKYHAYISYNNKRIYGGWFISFDEAKQKRQELARLYKFHVNHGMVS